MKTVFFGPFIGEFGWEYLYWHAWVNKVSQSHFSDYKKIVASYPGRNSFYLYADEYWEHPRDVLDALKSCNGYITDYWLNGFPRPNSSVNKKFMGIIPYESWDFIEPNIDQVEVKTVLDNLMIQYKKILPENTIFFTPYEQCNFEGIDFGVKIRSLPESDHDISQTPIPFSIQSFQLLKPSVPASKMIKDYLAPDDKLIAIYPRNRKQRRLDKNWSKNKYLELIDFYKLRYPKYKIGIFGAPGQAYFDDDIPTGVLDFINVPNDQHMNLQIAALQNASLAVGSLSGGVLVSRAAGVPTLTWGLERDANRFHDENRGGTETIFHKIQNPDSKDIQLLSAGILDKKINYLVDYRHWDSVEFLKTGNGNIEKKVPKLLNVFKSKFYAKNRIFK